ncbi:MAG: hypothetical protein KKG84_00705, partial [Candidatus Omnitrophica bacterium]|nr:hypothetical protein [Candidatus Omnitrophota bacterium]
MDMLDVFYLTKVTAGENIDIKTLQNKDPSKARSSLFVAYILTRKWDPHLLNVGYEGHTPIALDHDQCFRYDLMNNTDTGFMIFKFNFLNNMLFATVSRLAPELNSVLNGILYDIEKERETGDYETAYRNGLEKFTEMIRKHGFGDGFIAAEILDQKHIEESILEFKSVKNVRKLSEKAGYEAEELEKVVSFIEENQKRLGKDVNDILELITGRNYGFDRLDTSLKSSVTQGLFEEFKESFPENYKMMLGMFGEFVIKNDKIKEYFYKLMRCHKGVLSKNRALYFASLLRIEEGFTPGEYKLRYRIEGQNGEVSFGSAAFNELEDEFLRWAVRKNISLDDLSLAYGLYLKKKKEMLRLKEHGKGTKMTIRAGKKLGEELYGEFDKLRTARHDIRQVIYKGDVVDMNKIRWIKLSENKNTEKIFSDHGIISDDISIGVVPDEDGGKYDIYIFTDNEDFIDRISQEGPGDFDSPVPIGYANIRVENNVPVIYALQPRFYLPHDVRPELKQYVEGGIYILSQVIEDQVQEIIQTDRPVERIRSLTAAWHMVNSKIAESTAQHYYMNVPEETGYSLVALDEPVILSRFFKINFIYEKELVKSEDRDLPGTGTREYDIETEIQPIVQGKVDKKEELKHAEMFSDIIKLINTESERKGLTFMLGTSWIK